MTEPASAPPEHRSSDPALLDIIVVNWNTRELTEACLRSVFERLGTLPARIWVVDNGSSDGSAEAIGTSYPEVHLIRNHENRGFAAANNQALKLADAPYALLLNSDTVVLGEVLQRSLDYMEAHPEVGVFGCRVLNPDRTLQPTCFQYPTLLNSFLKMSGLHRLRWPRFFGREHMRDWARDSERDVDVVTGCYMWVRRKAVEEVGLLDEQFFFNYEETDWCRRFRRAGWGVRFAPVGEIIHVGNASGRKINHLREIHLIEGKLKLHRKHGGALQARAIWLFAWSFWASRVLFWGLASALTQRGSARERAALGRQVLAAFPSSRPAERG